MRTLTAVKTHRAAPVKPHAPASASQVLAVLQKTLSKTGVLAMPPKAVEFGANELTGSAKFVKGTHAETFGKLKSAMVDQWTQTYGGPRAGNPDAWQELQERSSAKKDVAFARAYLAKAVAPAERATVEKLLKHPALKDAHVSFVQSWDSASEIIGYDRLQITPKGAKYSLVVSLDYVEA